MSGMGPHDDKPSDQYFHQIEDLRQRVSAKPKPYIECLQEVANTDVAELRKKDAEYGGSWKKRGGVGAYMMACRKMDRLEEQLKKVSYDIFAAIEGDNRAEGVLDDIRDLRRYLMLIEAEMVARGVVK